MVKQPLRVLIVEDSELDTELLLEQLGDGPFDVAHQRVQTADDMRAALRDRQWDLVITDYSMPGFDGLEAVAIVRASGLDIPLIVSSGTIGEELAVAALKSGASDFVVKGNMSRLIPAIERELREAASRQQRRATETTLAETRERMRFALDAAHLGTWEIDFTSGAVTWSDLMQRLHGLEPGAFSGTLAAFAACIHPDDRERVLDGLTHSAAGHGDARLEYRTACEDAATHWVAVIGQSFAGSDGAPHRAAGVGLDISAQKSLEVQLRQAQKMEAIGALAAGIAHDFNNLLTVMTGYCELLNVRLISDPEGSQELREIRRSTESATALTRQLLTFSRRQALSPRIIDLNAILTDSQAMLRRLVEENVRIEMRLGESLPSVSIDPGQIEQVLLNLVINARDAMPDGGAVEIATRSLVISDWQSRPDLNVRPGRYVQFSVRDTGTGMSAEVQARLFEPFFTTKDRNQGTGLGLATVYGIVKQNGGTLTVRSEVGKGSVFDIYLPSTEAKPEAPVVDAPVAAAAVPDVMETILVVEDDPGLRTLSERVLRRRGYHVLTAGDGDHARQVCEEYAEPIHVVLLDLIMPGISGWEVGDWISQRRPDAKIVYTSGYSDSATRLRTGSAFLHKPFTPDALASKIREALS